MAPDGGQERNDGRLSEQELLDVPTEFLETYPLPVFILRVCAPLALPHKKSGRRSRAPATSDDGSSVTKKPPKAAEQEPRHNGSMAMPDVDLENDGSWSGEDNPITDRPNCYRTIAPVNIAPVSAPLSAALKLVWTNRAYTEALGRDDVTKLVEPHMLASFKEWVEGDVERESTNVAPSSTFALDFGEPLRRLRVVKSRQPMRADSKHCLVVMFANDNVQPVSKQSSIVPSSPKLAIPKALVGSTPLANNSLSSSTFSTMMPYRRRTRHRLRYDPPNPHPVVKQCHLLLDEIDWSKTSLGSRSSWPPEIESMVNIAFSSFTQDCVYIGKDLHMVYNQNYSIMVDHPRVFGMPIVEVWGPLWDFLKPLFDRAMAGEPIHRENDLVLHQRNTRGRFVERYQSYSLIPILGRDKDVVGVYNPSLDTTAFVLYERRRETGRSAIEELSRAQTVHDCFAAVGRAMEDNAADVPFAIFYRVTVNESSETQRSVTLTLETTIGVPTGHPCAPETITTTIPLGIVGNLENLSIPDGPISCPWPIERALAINQCVVVNDCSDIIEGLPVRQWDELPDMAVVMPFEQEDSRHTALGVAIVGLNLYRPLDLHYEAFIQGMRSNLRFALGMAVAREEELTRREEKEKLEHAKTTWLRGSAHEFRTPLSLIAAPLDDLWHTDMTSGQRHSLALAQRNVQRLQQLVTSLLEFSRMEAGQVTARFVPTDLSRFVSALAEVFRPAIAKLNLHFEVDIEPRTEPVPVDPVLFEMVVSNLLINALKHTDHGRVSLRVHYDDKNATVSVLDTGTGALLGEEDPVFSSFESKEDKRSSGTDSSGVGLALAREIVKLHHGELLVNFNSEPDGPGSTLIARIPLHQAAVDTSGTLGPAFGTYGRQVANEVRLWTGGDISSPDENDDVETIGRLGQMDGLMFEASDVLLVIDGNPDMRGYLTAMFEPFCTVVTAGTASEALERAHQRSPDLILCDVLINNMSTVDFIRTLRADQAQSFAPTVILSAVTDDDARMQALLAGVDDYLTKPFKPKELLLRVHLHMQMGKKRAELERLFSVRSREIATLSDYCPSGIIRTDANGFITYMNLAFLEPAGMTGEENYRRWKDLWNSNCDPETADRVAVVWNQILRGDLTTTRLKWKWNTGKTMSGVFMRLDSVHSSLSGILGCVTDVTHHEEKLHEAECRRIEAEESRRQQELLVDLISHEIRTPVSAILQCSSLVKENVVALTEQLRLSVEGGFKASPELLSDLEEDVHALDSIYQCGLLQERIAGDVLSLTRIQLDMLSVHEVDVELQVEAKRVLSVFSFEAKMKKVEIALHFGPTLQSGRLQTIKTDPVRLGQVLTNLVSNGIRFTAAGESRERRIDVTYEVSLHPPTHGSCAMPRECTLPITPEPVPENLPVYLYVSVADTGPGLSESEKAVLFKRFHQGNKMIHTRFGGSGLGLFICKKITELLGGGIQLESEVGKGTTSSSTSKAGLQPTRAVARAASAPEVLQGRALPSQEVDKLYVLIVEDNLINQQVLRRQLTKAGIKCDTASNGQEALMCIFEANRKARHHDAQPYDVTLMDLEMPVMDGLTAVRKIRDAERDGTLPKQIVIALTGNARKGQIETALEAGMDSVVLKPYHLDQLLPKIQEAARSQRDSRAAAEVAVKERLGSV